MKNFKKYKINSGITLIELLVVISIFTIISAITLFDYTGFKSTSALQNLADDIALSIRKAQGYAIGVRGYDNTFNSGYGIHFTSNYKNSKDGVSSVDANDFTSGSVADILPNTNSDLSSSHSFMLFLDVDNNHKYDGGEMCGSPSENNECVEVFTIPSDSVISGLYINDDEKPIDSNSSIDILFKRPNPEPQFCYTSFLGSSDCDFSTSISYIKIELSSINNPNVHKYVVVYNNGQISVL